MLDRLRTPALRAFAVTLLVLSSALGASAAGNPRIVNGLETHDFPSTGALLAARGGGPITADNAATFCTGTLIGCRTFLTAAHCIAGDTDPAHYWVYLQHAGTLAVESVAVDPAYTGLGGNDVAIVKLTAAVTGIAPTPINATHDLSALGFGFAGTIVGFGLTVVPGRDFGIKRFGAVQTASCVAAPGGEGNAELVCWDFALPVGSPGTDSDTCNGDSGGPLFLDFGGVTEVVGVTSSGSQPFCRPLDHSWDASVYHNAAWIQAQLGADATTTCGGIGPVGTASATVTALDGVLSGAHPSDAFTLAVPSGTAVLRLALNGEDNVLFNPDLYVKQGPGASPTTYHCKTDGVSVYGGCELVSPLAGEWSVFVNDAAGAGRYQVTAVAFAAPAALCGNGAVDLGEECDEGAANGTAAACCTAACRLQASATPCADDGQACTLDQCDGASARCGHAPLPDADLDGLCDAIDPCTNVGHGQDFIAAAHPKLVLAKVGTDPVVGNDAVGIGVTFALAPGVTLAALDPESRGARLVVVNGTATATRLDVTLPGSTFGGGGTRGWKANGARTVWTFKDATGAPLNGITSVQIKAAGKKYPGAVSVKVTGKDGVYPVVAGDEPLAVVVGLGNQSDAAAGACGESTFSAGDCAWNGKGSTLACKQ